LILKNRGLVMIVMKYLFFWIVLLKLLVAATTLHHSGVNLGEPRVYTSFRGELKLELTLIRVGKRSDKQVLISFNVPGHELHRKSFIYAQECETMRCRKLSFKQKGGSRISLMGYDGYHSKFFKALLPGETQKIPLRYSQLLSQEKSSESLFENYLSRIYRDRSFVEIKALLASSVKAFNQSCHAKATMKNSHKMFQQNSHIKLLGMGKPMLDEITTICKDTLYREVFQNVKKVSFEFSKTYQTMLLTKGHELIIFLSPDLYNPSVTAKHALNLL